MYKQFVSVIIPVYNAENYLHRSLESLLNQTYADFEVILINDGSTDRSGNICDEYASKDSRIRVFHKKNEGVSATRNFGIKKSDGELITFIDADDVVLKNYLFDLISAMESETEMVISAVEQQNGVKTKILVRSYNGVIAKTDFLTLMEKLQIANFGYAIAILYKKTIIVENNIRFDTRLAQSEDLLFVLDYIHHLKKDVKCVPSANYLYIMDIPNSGSKKRSSAESINLQLSLIYEMISKKYQISDFKSFPFLSQLLDYLYYKKLSDLIGLDFNIVEKINNIKVLDKDMIYFFQNIKKKNLRAKVLDFLLHKNYYRLFLKLRNL